MGDKYRLLPDMASAVLDSSKKCAILIVLLTTLHLTMDKHYLNTGLLHFKWSFLDSHGSVLHSALVLTNP